MVCSNELPKFKENVQFEDVTLITSKVKINVFRNFFQIEEPRRGENFFQKMFILVFEVTRISHFLCTMQYMPSSIALHNICIPNKVQIMWWNRYVHTTQGSKSCVIINVLMENLSLRLFAGLSAAEAAALSSSRYYERICPTSLAFMFSNEFLFSLFILR